MNRLFSTDLDGPAPCPGNAGGYFRPTSYAEIARPGEDRVQMGDSTWVGASNGSLLTADRAAYDAPAKQVKEIDMDVLSATYGVDLSILCNMADTPAGRDSLERMWDDMSNFKQLKTETDDQAILRRINARDERRPARRFRDFVRAAWNHPVEMSVFIWIILTAFSVAYGFVHGEKMAAKSSFEAGYNQAQQEMRRQ